MKQHFWKRILVFALSLCGIIFLLSFDSILANDNNSEKIIADFVDSINEKQWEVFSSLWNSSEEAYYKDYFADESIQNGVKQIESIELKEIYSISFSDAKSSLLIDEYPILKSSEKVDTYIISVDCNVIFENNYFYNGINYFFIALAEEDDIMKISQFNRPSMDLIDKYVVNSISSIDEDYVDELAGINVIENADSGLLVNADNEILENGFDTYSIENKKSEVVGGNNVTLFSASDSTSTWEILDYYSKYSYPSTIKVKSYGTINFETYCKAVLPNEWYASWHVQALNVGAFCVRMVGWYHTIKPVSATGGYDVTTTTQNYVKGSANTRTSKAIDDTYRYIMVNSSDKIFFAEYGQGSLGNIGNQGGGKLLQYGSQALAQDGYLYYEILNYYYSGSRHSIGDVRILKYCG